MRPTPRAFIPIIFALALTLGTPVAGRSAPLAERVEAARDKVDRKRQREGVLSEAIVGYENRIDGLEGQIGSLQARERRLKRELVAQRAELLEIRGRLERTRERLDRLRSQLGNAQRALGERLVEIYKTDKPDLVTVVLEADGFADLLERAEFLERVSQQDRRIVARVRVLKDASSRRAAELRALEQRSERALTALRTRRAQLAAARARLARARGDLQTARSSRRRTLASVRRSRGRAQEDLQALQAESARIERRLRVQQAAMARSRAAADPQRSALPAGPSREPAASPDSDARTPDSTGSSELIWPVSGTITSPFGQRGGRLHAGLDIGAASGTPIRAAGSGRIVVLGPEGAYGLYTCIQHTASLSTCYAHQSGFATSSGASVKQGQVIGYVGNTGRSFGAHLHFETRVGGAPRDPLGYLG